MLRLDRNNIGNINYNNIYVQAFFNKLVEILNFSFEKEREYSIKQGLHEVGYKHNLDTIKNNIHHPNFVTVILCSHELEPISFLYIEQNEDDYDKIWTVCTDNAFRGQGMSSKLLEWTHINQLNNNRHKMLLEVFEDDIINRDENDVLQSQIMSHFSKNGYDYTPLENLDKNTFNNLMKKNGETKIMIFNPQRWYNENSRLNHKLNSNIKKMFYSN